MKVTKYIEFSLDYDGNCECIDTFEVNGEDRINEISESNVDEFVEKLSKFDEFLISEHRTEVRVSWFDHGKMFVDFRYFNEPEDGEFDDHEFETDSIDIVYGED